MDELISWPNGGELPNRITRNKGYMILVSIYFMLLSGKAVRVLLHDGSEQLVT